MKRKESTLSPTNKLFRSYSIAVGAVFFIGMISPSYAHNTFYNVEDTAAIDEFYNTEAVMLADQDGYLSKINPQTESSDRSAMDGVLIHEVEPGDTLSTIANGYGLKTSTVLWQNGLYASDTLKVGQKLTIPAVDGISHTITKGQDLKKIATLYSVGEENILKQNKLESTTVLKPGQSIFIPGGKPLPSVIDRTDPSRIASSTRVGAPADRGAIIYSTEVIPGSAVGSASSSSPAEGKLMIKPTRGAMTQGYHAGHYALDLADSSKPPIWSAMEGTVIKASSGTWGGGYGNYVIIDHGNGLQTLYAHMENISVHVGDVVSQGQVIGKMGRTGRVRGKTGIHLHFEVHKNGEKVLPSKYF